MLILSQIEGDLGIGQNWIRLAVIQSGAFINIQQWIFSQSFNNLAIYTLVIKYAYYY